jgi:exodeoxyribonuclease VIII
MTYAEYAALPGTNWSTLKELAKSPLHYQHLLERPRKDTPALKLGRAVHCAVFEPDELLVKYAVWQGGRRAGKDWNKFRDANSHLDILSVDEYRQACAIRDAVHAHPAAGIYVSIIGGSEHVIQWTDRDTGIDCKARLDKLVDRVVELKTARDIDHRLFSTAVARYQYHGQLAFYHDGAQRHLDTILNPPVIIAVESSPPHDVVVYSCVFLLDHGRDLYRKYLRTLAECRALDYWPGRAPLEEQVLELPAWAQMEDDDGGLDWGGVEEVKP